MSTNNDSGNIPGQPIEEDLTQALPDTVITPQQVPSNGPDAMSEALGGDAGCDGVRPGIEAADKPAPAMPVIDVLDLDWAALRDCVCNGGVRSRLVPIVSRMEDLLHHPGKAGMLFDSDRSSTDDKAIRVSQLDESPLWFIGDLHGDLLALEAALLLIRTHSGHGSEKSKIIFLGDLFDDEGFGLEVLLRVYEVILENPALVCIIAGNHDEALGHNGTHFTSSVSPSDFSDFLNINASDEWIRRAALAAIALFNSAPRALFFPDGLLVAHGGFPLVDLHPQLETTSDWNNPDCLSDFVWTRAHPTARKKLPNRFSRGSQFGFEDFAAFCALAARLGRPVTHMIRGHDHVEHRFQTYPAYSTNPILTTVALSRRLSREFLGPHERTPTVARYVEGAMPQIFRLQMPPGLSSEIYPEALDVDDLDDAAGTHLESVTGVG